MYTKEEMIEDFEEARSIVYQAGLHEIESITVLFEVSPNYTKWLGQCQRKDVNTYIIRINQPYASQATHNDIIATLVHEALHCLKNCYNHGKHFHAACRDIYAYNGMKIDTHAENTPAVKQYVEQRKVLKYKTPHTYYELWCRNCGKKIKTYERNCNTVMRISMSGKKSGIYHTRCGSHDLYVRTITQ